MTRALRAAGITDPRLQRAYASSRRLNARHGRTYYLATLLLPPAKRPFVHALYGFARYADEIVDDLGARDPRERAAALSRLRAATTRALAGHGADAPVLAALSDTVARWRIDPRLFDTFLDSMAMDLTTGHYDTYADLCRYMDGSAAAIGLQMLPILEPSDVTAAAAGARSLGEAFQLANFVRDVGEDLDRGRIYLPLDELAVHGVTPTTLATRVVDDGLREALTEQIARVRELSVAAAATVRLLHPSVRDCIDTARVLYCEIADQVAAADFQVFRGRVRVPASRRAAIALPAWRRARQARAEHGAGTTPPPAGDGDAGLRAASAADR